MRESEIIKNAGRLGAITIATNMAGRGTDIKIDEQVKAVGGLYMLGTEHSESRRVDNQLRGRSGRQGDIGETRFFISIDDELFRRYALDRIQKIIAKSNDEFIDSRFYTTIINALQKKVEGFNFDMRKNLIDYDSVLSNQRELIYRQRDTILLNADNAEILNNMCVTCAKDIVNTNIDENNGVYAKAENITSILNKVIFNQEMINKDFFEHKTISNSIDEIAHILQVSVAKRISELGPNQAPQLIKSLLIQNLDHQ
jgi:preprotein translocase subunit SecA